MQYTDALTRLALDRSWSWNHSADEIGKKLDPELWELLAEAEETDAAPAWFQAVHGASPLRSVAYFSMEYMLSEALPIYSGGPARRHSGRRCRGSLRPPKHLGCTGTRPGQRPQATRAAADLTPRILPHHAMALGPEICRIVWQK